MAIEDCKTLAIKVHSTREGCMNENRIYVFASPFRFVEAAEYLLAHPKFGGYESQENQNLVDSAVRKWRVGSIFISERDGASDWADDDCASKRSLK